MNPLKPAVVDSGYNAYNDRPSNSHVLMVLSYTISIRDNIIILLWDTSGKTNVVVTLTDETVVLYCMNKTRTFASCIRQDARLEWCMTIYIMCVWNEKRVSGWKKKKTRKNTLWTEWQGRELFIEFVCQ